MKMTVLNVKITILSTKNPIASNKKKLWHFLKYLESKLNVFILVHNMYSVTCLPKDSYRSCPWPTCLHVAQHKVNLGSPRVVLRQSLVRVKQSSGSLQTVMGQSLGSCQQAYLSGSCLADIRQSSGSRQTVLYYFYFQPDIMKVFSVLSFIL